jgi:DNA invertase Pin-like site-specific DNA recombinase
MHGKMDTIGWDVSRFGRSMKEFVHFLSDMDDRGIGVVAVKNGLDSSSSTGRMMMKLIGVLEEWNREMLVERTKFGLARTVANGTKLGRKSVLSPSINKKIVDAKERGLSIRKIAAEVGVGVATVHKCLKVVNAYRCSDGNVHTDDGVDYTMNPLSWGTEPKEPFITSSR